MRDLREVKSRYEFQLDNKQLVFLFAGMVVILILAFLLGTLFGKNLYSIKAAAPAPAVEPAVEAPLALEGASAEAPAGVSPEEQAAKKLMAELAEQKLPSAPPGGPASPPTPAKKTEASAPAAPATPTSVPPAREPEPAPQTVGAGPYTIQLAASQNREEAEALKNKLVDKKYDAYVLKVEIPGKGLWYRVRVGHYQSREQAEKALRIIKSREPQYSDAFVTK